MIDPKKLTQADVGRNVTYKTAFCETEHGTLTSWNEAYVFVRFKGTSGEACRPEDVRFDFEEPSS